MVNINKLKGKIIEKGLTIERLAIIIQVDKSTLYRRLSNRGETFIIKEIDAIVKALDLSKEDARDIFFKNFVA